VRIALHTQEVVWPLFPGLQNSERVLLLSPVYPNLFLFLFLGTLTEEAAPDYFCSDHY
jgi:hypothetical protein